jgi:hypothetical protein
MEQFIHAIQWRYPHKPVIQGMRGPVLLKVVTEDRAAPVYMDELYKVFLYHGFMHYCFAWGYVQEIKRMDPVRKAKMLRTRKINETRKKYPLLADLFLEGI